MESVYYNDISNLAVEVFSKKVKSTLGVIKNSTAIQNEDEQTIAEQITAITIAVEKILTGFRFYSFTKENCFALWEIISKDSLVLDIVLESCDVFFLRLVQFYQDGENDNAHLAALSPFLRLAETVSTVITLGRKIPEREIKGFFKNLTKDTVEDNYIANDEFFARGMDRDSWNNLFLCNPWLLFIAILKTSNVDLLEFFGVEE